MQPDKPLVLFIYLNLTPLIKKCKNTPSYEHIRKTHKLICVTTHMIFFFPWELIKISHIGQFGNMQTSWTNNEDLKPHKVFL